MNIMKTLKHLLPLAAMTLALFVAAACGNDSARQKDTLTVMSYNIRAGVARDWENGWAIRAKATPEMLKTVKPDIFGVQEAYDFQIYYIEHFCPEYKSYGIGREPKGKGEHMSIFYNTEVLEMLDHGTYWLSETPDEPSKGWDAACIRTATWALMKDLRNDRQFFFVNTHLDHKGAEARKNGLALVVDKIAAMNPDGLPMVLTGDLNVEPGDPCLDDIEKLMSNARTYAESSDDRVSFQGFGKDNSSIIDYIYYSGFSSCSDFKVVAETFADVPYISDHYPVKAVLVY